MLDGRQITLQTKDVEINALPMRAIEKFLYTIADPNVAYILLSLAMLGITAEIFNPGLIFPGAIGGICLLLAFYSLGVLPVNYAGIGLIILAFGLFIGEALTPGIGFFIFGGIISLVIGSLILFRGAAPVFRVNPWLIAGMTIVIAGLFAFVIGAAFSIHRKQATTGREDLIGKTAVVKVALNPSGTVFYKGERWTAVSESGTVKVGEEVIIERIDGLTLYVKRK
jgi:membrane-bound serine protease (ClpP class)